MKEINLNYLISLKDDIAELFNGKTTKDVFEKMNTNQLNRELSNIKLEDFATKEFGLTLAKAFGIPYPEEGGHLADIICRNPKSLIPCTINAINFIKACEAFPSKIKPVIGKNIDRFNLSFRRDGGEWKQRVTSKIIKTDLTKEILIEFDDGSVNPHDFYLYTWDDFVAGYINKEFRNPPLFITDLYIAENHNAPYAVEFWTAKDAIAYFVDRMRRRNVDDVLERYRFLTTVFPDEAYELYGGHAHLSYTKFKKIIKDALDTNNIRVIEICLREMANKVSIFKLRRN